MKKTSNTGGDKLDRTGGKITGNLNIEGTLKNNNKTILDLTYPVGSIYMSIKSTNPSSLFGGIWEAWGSGRVPVGVDTSQTEFATVEKTGGNKDMQKHYHDIRYNDATGSGVTISCTGDGVDVLNVDSWSWQKNWTNIKGESGSNLYTNYEGTGDSGNLQPYITCYMFKRVG